MHNNEPVIIHINVKYLSKLSTPALLPPALLPPALLPLALPYGPPALFHRWAVLVE